MRGIILAAGRGRRMKELGDQIPKCLIELQGKPLLEYQLRTLRQAGINEIALVFIQCLINNLRIAEISLVSITFLDFNFGIVAISMVFITCVNLNV